MRNKLTRDEYIKQQVEIAPQLLQMFDKNESLSIFDIGACECEDSIRYSELFPNSTIYAFEPRPDNIVKSREIIKEYNKKNIHLESIALSDKEGEAIFYLSEGEPKGLENDDDWDYGNKSSSLLEPSSGMSTHTSWLKFDKSLKVKTLRLDEYVKNKKIKKIDISHIDVQGAELMVLKGAGSFINHMNVIWLEVESVELYKDQPLKNDIEAFMVDNNFVNILDTVGVVSGDRLYINKHYFSKENIDQFKKSMKKNKLKDFISGIKIRILNI